MTIKDLARLSGYSLGTVSRVLNNQPNVSDKARETIMAIVKEAGFELNSNAKNLKQQRSNSIVVIVKGRANELFAQLVEQIQTRVAGTDYPLIVHYIDEDENEVHCALQLCREKKPVGILFLGGTSENFLADFGEAVTINPGETPVFWACGVTPQSIVMHSKPEFCITHAPGHMLITDVKNADLKF